jgi:hypothetical protein
MKCSRASSSATGAGRGSNESTQRGTAPSRNNRNGGRSAQPADKAGQLGNYMIYAGDNERMRKRQSRTGRWRNDRALEKLKVDLTRFVKGSKATQQRMAPTIKELIANVNKEYHAHKKGEDSAKMSCKAVKIAAARRRQGMVIGDLLKDIVDGGHGFVPPQQPDDTVRVVMEN